MVAIGLTASLPAGCRKGPSQSGSPASPDEAGAAAHAADDHYTAVAPSADTDTLDDSSALSAREQFLSELSEEARHAFLAGDRALAEGRCETAVDAFAQAAQLHPDNVELLRALAEAMTAAHQYDRVTATYEQILALGGEDPVTLYNLAVAYTRLKEYYRAERAYRELLEIDEQHLRARYNLAVVYHVQGKLDDACRTWRAYIRQDDNNAAAYMLLGELLLQLRQPEEALVHLCRASVLAPDDLVTQLNLAAAAKLTGSYGWAAMALEKAASLAPDDAEIWADLGEVLLTIHRDTGDAEFLTEAIAAGERALAIDPDQPALREYLATYRGAAPDSD